MSVNSDSSRNNKQLTRADWVSAARRILIDQGINHVRLRPLAQSLGVTTGAFYWQYKNLRELHDDLRKDWASTNTEPFTEAIEAAGSDGWRQYLAYVRVLMLDGQYDPDYDNAVRDWGHASPATAKLLREIDTFRIEQLRSVFLALGFVGQEALIRARVTYFHQIGYQAMRVHESVEERLTNVPYYAEILTENRTLFSLGGPEGVRAALKRTRD